MVNTMVNRVNILHPHGWEGHLDNFAAKQWVLDDGWSETLVRAPVPQLAVTIVAPTKVNSWHLHLLEPPTPNKTALLPVQVTILSESQDMRARPVSETYYSFVAETFHLPKWRLFIYDRGGPWALIRFELLEWMVLCGSCCSILTEATDDLPKQHRLQLRDLKDCNLNYKICNKT